MIKRTFSRAEHPDFGFTGWKPSWMPNGDPLEAMGCTHDILEHVVDKISGAEGEMMAFGCALFVRGEGGYWNGRHHNEPSDNLSSDFNDILPRIFQGAESMQDPGRTYQLSDGWVEQQINDTVRKGFQLVKSEQYLDEPLPKIPGGMSQAECKRRMVGWMRKGYRAAVRYYRGRYRMDAYTAGHMFNQIQEEIAKYEYAEIGMEMTVRVDLRYMDVTIECDYPRDPYDD
jgi:hypothetical protein